MLILKFLEKNESRNFSFQTDFIRVKNSQCWKMVNEYFSMILYLINCNVWRLCSNLLLSNTHLTQIYNFQNWRHCEKSNFLCSKVNQPVLTESFFQCWIPVSCLNACTSSSQMQLPSSDLFPIRKIGAAIKQKLMIFLIAKTDIKYMHWYQLQFRFQKLSTCSIKKHSSTGSVN